MHTLPGYLASRAMGHSDAAWTVPDRTRLLSSLVEREFVPYNTSHPNKPGLVEAETVDPWTQAGKYALAWVYLCVILAVLTAAIRFYHVWTDKVRAGIYKEEMLKTFGQDQYDHEYELSALPNTATTATSKTNLYSWDNKADPGIPKEQSAVSSMSPFNNIITLFRYLFYRSLPAVRLSRKSPAVSLLSTPIIFIVSAAFIMVTLYCFIPQPYYRTSLEFGSPPLAIRAGMLAVSTIPWIVVLSMKSNLLTLITGISHEKLNILHRWSAYICLYLSILHTIPFYVQTGQNQAAYLKFKGYFGPTGEWLYNTGFAALGPLAFLCIHSLPFLRNWMRGLFIAFHLPAAIVFLAMVFWHCRNYLTSWHYLYVTIIFWIGSYIYGIFFLNWLDLRKPSWVIGDEASITAMAEGAAKVTIPTQVRWKPGQYVYLRMPGISVLQNNPCMITSICSADLPSDYGDEYRDMVLVFRPQEKFTKKLLEKLKIKGSWHTYRAFIDGPYGGSIRHLEAFDTVIFIAGGSGLSAILSHLMTLIKLQRDGKAVTKNIRLVMAMKRPESMEWFKEEIRTCQEFALPGTLQCQFYLTAAKRSPTTGQLVSAQSPSRPVSGHFHEKVNEMFHDIATNRWTYAPASRNYQALEDDGAADDGADGQEKEYEYENGQPVSPPMPAHIPKRSDSLSAGSNNVASVQAKRRHGPQLSLNIPKAVHADTFGIPQTPAQFQQSVMQFASLPADIRAQESWSTDYGRPDLVGLLREFSKSFGKRTCVFVAGPPSMRVDVANTVAKLQMGILRDPHKDELFLHSETYAVS